jgi:hypothetical protein
VVATAVVATAVVATAVVVMAVAAMEASYNASRRLRCACTPTNRNTLAYPPRSAPQTCDICAF